MNSIPCAGEKDPGANLNLTLQIVGKSDVQNKLLASFLEEILAIPCERYRDIRLPGEPRHPAAPPLFLLVDCQGRENIDPWAEYDLNAAAGKERCFLALYNVHPDVGIEARAVDSGVHGIFYNQESISQLPKGLRAILKGELWFSRNVLANLLRSSKTIVSTKPGTDNNLTHREKEILTQIVVGATNQEISEAFLISSHTVKSHIYSIYKKIRVNNRFQASLWAVSHFEN